MSLCLSWDIHKLGQLKSEIKSLESSLNDIMSQADLDEAHNIIDTYNMALTNKVNKTQKRNFSATVFHSLGTTDLHDLEEHKLYKPKSDWEPAPGKCGALESYIDAVESDIEKLLSMPDKTPDNLSKEERSALQSLKNRDDIVIKKADKGSTVVVMDKETYMAEAQRQLSQTNVSIRNWTLTLLKNSPPPLPKLLTICLRKMRLYSRHQIVPFQQRKSTLIYPKCAKHPTKACELQSKECDIPICALCSASKQHEGHKFLVLEEVYNSKKNEIAKDTEELQDIISPTYEEITNDLETQIANLDGEYEKLTTAVTEHGKQWHKEIDNVINAMKQEIEDFKTKHPDILKKHAEEIKQLQSLLKETLVNLKKIEESNEVSMSIKYSSRNKEFSKLPPKIQVSLPMFNPQPVDREQLYKLVGILSPLSTTKDEHGYKLHTPGTSTRKLLEESELITSIDTGYKKIFSVVCLSEEEIWASGFKVSDMKCYYIQGLLIKTIKTKTGEWPRGIAVTSDGSLVYSNGRTKTVNKVKNGQTEEMIRLQGWKPLNLCVTSSGDLLVTMYSDDQTQSKGSTEKQTIRVDEEGKPLYSGNHS
ncbi:uncharacterized protein LOC134282739 [Saccostrea cucullata]|uniref:uncharacterized protein LOC134282739 n=1 Tax=Saccostrea cuccullata TaxID=36930 RepID=UPI002ED648A4